MMTQLTRKKWGILWFGLFLLFAAPRIADYVITEVSGASNLAYDATHPVAVMQGALVTRGPDFAIVHIQGEKPVDKRRHCTYEYMQFFAIPKVGIPLPVAGTALDVEDQGRTKPTGMHYDLGRWQLYAPPNTQKITAYVNHSCDGRPIQTQIVDLTLPT